MTDAMIQEELASYLSDADRKTESPDTSFINSPSQTIPTENSSITNLKGFYNADIGNQLNQDALHSILENLEQSRCTRPVNLQHSLSSSSMNEEEVMTKPEFINPVLLSSATLPKLPSSLSPTTSAQHDSEADGTEVVLPSNNSNLQKAHNNLFMDSSLGNDYDNEVVDFFDVFGERDSLILNDDDADDEQDHDQDQDYDQDQDNFDDSAILSGSRRVSKLLSPTSLQTDRRGSLTQTVELASSNPQTTHANAHEETDANASDISKTLNEYSLDFHSASKLTKYRNRRQSVHGPVGSGVTKRKPSLESPLTSPTRTLQALSNANNQYRLTNNAGALNSMLLWEDAVLSDDDDLNEGGDRRNMFIASPASSGLFLNGNEDAALEVVEPSLNVSPVFNPKSLSILDAKNIELSSSKSSTTPVKEFATPMSSRTSVGSLAPSIASSSTTSIRRRRRSAVTPMSSRSSQSLSRRNKSVSVELPDGAKPFQCADCDKAFRRSEHLKRHVRSVHSTERPFPCMFCEKKFSRSDNLSQHLKTHKRHGDF